MNRNEKQTGAEQGLSRQSDSRNKGMFSGFDNLFPDFFDVDRFFPSIPVSPALQQMRSQQPAVNIIENDNEYRIEVSAPGMKKKDFHIDMEDGRITISAERKYEHEEKSAGNDRAKEGGKSAQGNNNNERYTRREFGYSQFTRSFMLPDTVDPENVKANYQDGVLCLTLPKREEEKQRKQRRQIDIS